MENSPTESAPPRRRRSHRKSSKELYQRRKQLKQLGLWVLACVVGGLIVAGIAVYAGGAAD